MGRHRKPALGHGRQPSDVRVLFTCIGRRVELMNDFRRAGERLGVRLEVHGADATRLSPAIRLADKAHLVPRISSGKYVDSLLRIVKRSGIDLLIPLIDTELPVLATAVDRFADVECTALISAPSVIDTCRDKLATYRALKGAGIDTPKTWAWKELLKRKRHRFPYFLKPRAGSAAMGNYVVKNPAELRTFGRRVPEPIVQ
ncbi:MAG: hypothetical protein PVI86_17210, partial [Phycisphaerae bacterium]